MLGAGGYMEVLSPSKILEDDVARTVKAQRRNMQRAVGP